LRLVPIVAALALLALALFPAGASADPGGATIVVNTTDDGTDIGCSLRNAILAADTDSAVADCAAGSASSPDTIEVPGGNYTLAVGELQISGDVNIFGAGARATKVEGFVNGQRDLEISSGNVTIGGVTIEGGSTSRTGPENHAGLGGGIYVDFGATLTLQDSMVSGNDADTSGGGILNDGSLTILRSTIGNNTTGSGGTGAGVGNFLSLSITNSTIMGNQAQADGGGLYLAGPTTLTNDTIANNEANVGLGGGRGGGIANNGATVQLTNTLLAGNERNGVAENCDGGVTSHGGNLSDDTSCPLGAADFPSTDPQFGSLDSTGATDVMALQPGSPAIDTGNAMGCPATDQRLVPRPQGSGCDIGAYESDGLAPTDYYVSTTDELASALSSASFHELPATIHIAAGHYDTGNLIGRTGVGPDSPSEFTLAGAGAATTILDGDDSTDRVIDVGGTGITSISGVTVENSTDTGIYDNGDVKLIDSVVRNNTDVGIQSTNAGLDVSGSTIAGNGSAALGVDAQFNGGIFSEAPLTITNSTITGNEGSGVYVDFGGSAGFQSVTIAANPGVGLDLRDSGTGINTIIGRNTAGDCTNATGANWTSEHNNLDSDTSCGFVDLSDWPEVDPQLGPLRDNGGPTPTMAIASSSEALDHGDDANCPALDQRGVTRPQGPHCDIGAFELAPKAESIAFESNRTGNSQIFTMNPDGSNVLQLTHDPAGVTDTLPSISPDGHTVVYQSNTGGVDQIWAIDGDGSNPRRLTSLGTNRQPTFSPDGTKIAFDSNRNGNFRLFVMNADGSGQTQVMNTDGNVGGSSWSPDGSQIAFNDDTNGTNQIYTVDVGTGTVPGPLTSAGSNTNPHWSPDGSEILFVSTRCDPFGLAESPTCGGGESVYLMNPDGTNQHNLTSAPIFDADPAWSPDGTQIAFVRDLGGQAFNVFTANADGTNQVQLTNGGAPSRNSFPNWGTQVSGEPLSNLTVNVTPSSAGAGIDRVPISTIPNAWLSFFAGSTNSAPVGSTPVGSTPVGSTPVGSTPVGSTPVGSTPVGSTPVGSTPVGSTPVGSTGLLDFPVGSTPVGSTPVGSTALASLLLSQIPLCGDVPLPGTTQARCQADGATWAQVLASSPGLAGKPLNALTLADVVGSAAAKNNLEMLPLKDVSFATSLFKSVHWSTLLLGGLTLDSVPAPAPYDGWCDGAHPAIPANGGSCANVDPSTTLLQLDVAGQLGSAPVGLTPVGSTLLTAPVGSTPVGSTPVGSTDVSASLVANIPLLDIVNHDGDLSSVVNCTGSFSCTGKTLGDAYRANAILPTATFSNIKGAMAANDITVNDLVVAILGAAGFPWEQLLIQGLQPYSATPSKVTYTITNDVACSIAPEFTITAHLPTGNKTAFFPVDGSAQFSVGNSPLQAAGPPHIVGNDAAAAAKNNEYQWTIDCPAGDSNHETATLKFDAWVGLDLGTFTTHVTASTATASIGTTGAPVTVHQNPEASDPSTATEIQPDTLVAGHIAFGGEQAFYKLKLDGLPRGTRISAFLNVPSAADLDLTMSAPAAPSFFSTPVGSTPVGSTPIEDSSVGFSSGGLALPPDTLQDVPVGSTPVGSTPVGSTPVGSTSANRGTGVNEAGGIITTGQGGYATIGVSGYNGATSKQPFVLRVQETPPPALPNCPARTFPFAASGPGSLPSSLPTSTKTLFIVDKQRLTALYGSTAVTNLLNSLNTLATRAEVSGTVLFVDGDQGVRSAYSAWDAAPCDTTARNSVVRAINDVVASYRNSSTGLPNLHYVVLVGSDEATPMADAQDPVLLSPEENEAADLAFTTNGLTQGNALYASAAQNYILTDGAYGAFTNIPWLGRSLLLPQISVSRLVETPSDIIGQVNRYLGANGVSISAPQTAAGTLNPTSALVTGYDFLADGAQSVKSNLTTNLQGLSTPFDPFRAGVPAIYNPSASWKPGTVYAQGAIVQPTSANPNHLTFQAQSPGTSGLLEPIWPTSIGGTVLDATGITWKAIATPWNANDVLSSSLASTGSASSIVSLDAHYNHYELESASGDLANTGQATADLAARILFTMGCHGGLNVSDTLGSPTSPVNKYLDWPELYAQKQAAMYIANTGFGYGDTASVALSERLLALFAKNLHSDSGSAGEEWVNALQQYFATAGAYDVYDEKVMEETTFYGLPFWHFSTAGSSPSFTPLTTTADPNAGGTQSYTVTFPSGTTTQSQFGLYRPNLPITSQQVTSSLPARGVWVKALTSNDVNKDAAIGYPTIDLTAHEPAPNVSPIFFPARPFTLEHSLAFGSERDYLNVSDQFRPTGPGNAGVERSFTDGMFEIFYSQSADQVAPLISQVNVSDTSGMATVTARVTDDSGHVAEAAALVNDGTGWRYVQLAQSPQDPTLWTRANIPVSHDPEVFVEATDGVNVSDSANKGENFTSTNSNTPPSGVQILLQAPIGSYALNQSVNATYSCGSGVPCVGTIASGGPIDTSTPGLHTFLVQAYGADGNVVASLQRQYAVDYGFGGFFQPVNNLPTLNVTKAGSAIPVKFSLGGNQGLNIFYDPTYPASQQINCNSSAPLDPIETTVTAGGSSLSYDASSNQYTYVWKTNSAWSGSCRALVIRTRFGTSHTANFKFK
jgi:Tol biopolymer transport system component